MAPFTTSSNYTLPSVSRHGFTEDSEHDLLEWMSEGERCPGESRSAFAEFHARHATYLYVQCSKRYPRIAEEIV